MWLLGALGACAAAGGCFLLDEFQRPRLVVGPMLHVGGDGELLAVWSAESGGRPCESGEVLFSGADGAPRRAQATFGPGNFLAARLDVAGLTPPILYDLHNPGLMGRIVSLGRPRTTTAIKRRGEPLRFVAFGDSGGGTNSQFELADRMAAVRPDLAIHTGDVIYPGGEAIFYKRNLFDPYARLFEAAAFMPSLGNHDYGTPRAEPYRDAFVLPENGPAGLTPELNYWFDFGDARFVSLDTNRAESKGIVSEQQMRDVVAPWLHGVLSDPAPTWRFVFFHHPPYTGGAVHKEPSQAFVRDIFVPVFDATGVDVVFSGHNHLYERTVPLREGRPAGPGEHGSVYIVTGAGGVSLYGELEEAPAYIAAFNDRVFSFTKVDVTATALILSQVDIDGVELDRIVIEKP